MVFLKNYIFKKLLILAKFFRAKRKKLKKWSLRLEIICPICRPQKNIQPDFVQNRMVHASSGPYSRARIGPASFKISLSLSLSFFLRMQTFC